LDHEKAFYNILVFNLKKIPAKSLFTCRSGSGSAALLKHVILYTVEARHHDASPGAIRGFLINQDFNQKWIQDINQDMMKDFNGEMTKGFDQERMKGFNQEKMEIFNQKYGGL
jgi:hypothetical protein